MSNLVGIILKETGLDRWPPFVKDRLFLLALTGGVITCLIIWLTIAPTFSLQDRTISKLFFMGVIYYPVLEEILFRGIIQGSIIKKAWGIKKYLHLTGANWSSSVLFVFAHFWYQPMLWALMLFVPSLIFGFFRDRYSSIYPCIGLHMFYNAVFILVNLIAQ